MLKFDLVGRLTQRRKMWKAVATCMLCAGLSVVRTRATRRIQVCAVVPAETYQQIKS